MFLGIEFDLMSLDGATEFVIAQADRDSFGYVVTPNVDHILTLHDAETDGVIRSAYRDAMLVLNDSRVLEGLAWLAGRSLPVATGSDLTEAVLEHLNAKGAKAAIVGGDPKVLRALRRRYPKVDFAEYFPPPGLRYDADARLEAARFVEQAGAPFVFVACGAPQSEMICRLLAERNSFNGIALCIGSGIEFASGLKQRAPRWLQRLRLEWLFRLVQEPRRLARRYLVKGPRILSIWIRFRRSDRVL